MATTLDVGGSYEVVLRDALNKPGYKAAWQAAYLANIKFKTYEATLRGEAVFRVDTRSDPQACEIRKLLALWLRVIAASPSAESAPAGLRAPGSCLRSSAGRKRGYGWTERDDGQRD